MERAKKDEENFKDNGEISEKRDGERERKIEMKDEK
jgi:hypothetical protein